jgi:hypothetical protein
MQAGMECTSCGVRFYSSAWHQMLADGERCSCGGALRARTSSETDEQAPSMSTRRPAGGNGAGRLKARLGSGG